MSAQLLPRFALRLLVPALALSAIAMLGEPLPAPQDGPARIVVDHAGHERLAQALQQEAEVLQLEAEAARKAASQMRWFLTLPAAGRRCSTPGCTS